MRRKNQKDLSQTTDLALWGERISDELVLTLLADEPAVCTAALEVLRKRPPQAIPLDLILPYLQREANYIRQPPIKTVLAAARRLPIHPILSALHAREPQARAPAPHC